MPTRINITVEVNDLEEHGEGIVNCIKWAVIDGVIDHFGLDIDHDGENPYGDVMPSRFSVVVREEYV